MARGNDPGRDFDQQFERNRRRGQERAARGEGAWADDKYLRKINEERAADRAAAGNSEGCGKATVLLLGTLGGVVWFLAEAAGKAV